MGLKPISREGMNALMAELKQIQDYDRPPLMVAIQAARELGDLSENAEYQTAREKQKFMDKRIKELENLIKGSQIVNVCGVDGGKIQFGASVLLEDEDGKQKSFTLLGETESDITRGKISVSSPIGRALIGKCVGDLVSVSAPAGCKEYEILSVEYK